MRKEERKELVYKYIVIGIIIITFLCIALNPSTTMFVSRLFEIHKLKTNTEKLLTENEKYEKRLNYLKTKPKEMEKAAKMEFDYVEENEVEFVFEDDSPKENIEKDANKEENQ
jgi:cell division protein FtsB